MDIDWEAEWENLRNDDGESRVAEKNLAQATQKSVREFRKSWDRYLASFSTIPRPPANTSLRFHREVLSKRYKRTSADAFSRVAKHIKLYLMFRLVFFENAEAWAWLIFGLFVLQNIANGLPTGYKTTVWKAYKRHNKCI